MIFRWMRGRLDRRPTKSRTFNVMTWLLELGNGELIAVRGAAGPAAVAGRIEMGADARRSGFRPVRARSTVETCGILPKSDQ